MHKSFKMPFECILCLFDRINTRCRIRVSGWLHICFRSFIFHGLKRIFRGVERIFHGLERTFHAVEYKSNPMEQRKSFVSSDECMEVRRLSLCVLPACTS